MAYICGLARIFFFINMGDIARLDLQALRFSTATTTALKPLVSPLAKNGLRMRPSVHFRFY